MNTDVCSVTSVYLFIYLFIIIIIIIIIITLSNTTFSFLFYALFGAQRCPDKNQTVQVLPTGSQSAPGKPSSKE